MTIEFAQINGMKYYTVVFKGKWLATYNNVDQAKRFIAANS